jgi:hypothetical protein
MDLIHHLILDHDPQGSDPLAEPSPVLPLPYLHSDPLLDRLSHLLDTHPRNALPQPPNLESRRLLLKSLSSQHPAVELRVSHATASTLTSPPIEHSVKVARVKRGSKFV